MEIDTVSENVHILGKGAYFVRLDTRPWKWSVATDKRPGHAGPLFISKLHRKPFTPAIWRAMKKIFREAGLPPT